MAPAAGHVRNRHRLEAGGARWLPPVCCVAIACDTDVSNELKQGSKHTWALMSAWTCGARTAVPGPSRFMARVGWQGTAPMAQPSCPVSAARRHAGVQRKPLSRHGGKFPLTQVAISPPAPRIDRAAGGCHDAVLCAAGGAHHLRGGVTRGRIPCNALLTCCIEKAHTLVPRSAPPFAS